ncbi:glutamate synthase (NADPH/NADH) small chain [Pilibacter termitis]|uniref:Glutamate synthase (NADPH/NADH) small chain n=1 Tax=Pilibacter termitis TaxID=263852 RepID=A0A1T4NG45_9ENTE|nr:glutamate synthase subunit beta [Pilibacter termitis]SJZ77977.1 glutamate synthase (NADPH/NADH) small chain [Pilibacter termitis]
MADPFGFLKVKRKDNPYRLASVRVKDWQELQVPLDNAERQQQASRCMNCGIPFCHEGNFYGGSRAVSGCPNDNLIPEWNDYLFRGDVKKAFERLSRTNPLPEMTGRVCPAPCEKACTESLNGSGVTIHDNERFIIDTAFENDWVKETGLPVERKDKKIAIIGSGPAGLSAAWRANQLGYNVTVFEKSDRFGGLLMYGIPNMKLDKAVIDRRINVMKEVGITFVANCEVGKTISAEELTSQFDRVILAIGAGVPRDLNVVGRKAKGVEFAVDFLTKATKELLETGEVKQTLTGKRVVVIGGGDTGNDCLATAVRMGATSVKQLEITQPLPNERNSNNPWPEYPFVSKLGYGQEEAALVQSSEVTSYAISTTEFLTNEKNELTALKTVKVNERFEAIAGTEEILEVDLVLLAMGFIGAEQAIFEQFGISEVLDDYSTNNEKIFVAGDARRGPSLVIWGIREGRKAVETILNRDSVLVG